MKSICEAFKIFWPDFVKGTLEAPKLYFLPVLDIWKCCHHQQLSQDEKTTAHFLRHGFGADHLPSGYDAHALNTRSRGLWVITLFIMYMG